MANGKRWLITGCSTGFGRELATLLIGRGETVYATARNPEQIADLVEGHANAHALRLDVTEPDEVREAVAAVERDGGVDVLVNNAGYGYLVAFEEGTDEGVRAQFEANVFGLIAMTRAVLPGMRERRRGHIVQIASVGGLVGNAGSSYYAGTKFAVVGMSEGLSKEVAPLGIKVTIVEPGPFRTDWAGRSLAMVSERIPAYAETAHKRIDTVNGYSGRQPGDPVRAAQAIIDVVEHDDPPLHLVMGKPGLTMVRDKLAALTGEIDRWERVTLETDYPEHR